jgi:hypothetical protein
MPTKPGPQLVQLQRAHRQWEISLGRGWSTTKSRTVFPKGAGRGAENADFGEIEILQPAFSLSGERA